MLRDDNYQVSGFIAFRHDGVVTKLNGKRNYSISRQLYEQNERLRLDIFFRHLTSTFYPFLQDENNLKVK